MGEWGEGEEWLLRMAAGRRGQEQKDDFFFFSPPGSEIVYCKMSEVK